jgi:GH24 family phage-related lysozyme (muramidase)
LVSRRYWGKVEQPNTLNSNEYLGFIKDKEGFRDTAYKPIDTEEYYTIGYGNYSPDVQAGDTITREEADIQLQKNIDDRLVQIRQAIPEFDNLPLEARQHLLGSWFRGSLSGSPKTIGLINEGKFEEASKEFLNNDEYRTTNLGGVRKRMDATANAIRGLIS